MRQRTLGPVLFHIPCSLFPIVCCLILLATIAPCLAQRQIPAKSMESLQETFTLLRDKLWMRNEEFWHTGQHERCIAMMRLIAQIDPRDFDAYEDGAWLMESALRDEEAEAFLLQGLWSNPDDYEMYSTMGYFCYMRERFDEAVLYYEKAATFDPPKLVWHMLAHSYEHVGYVAQAFNVWWYVRALEPSDPVPHNQIDRIIRGGPPSDVPAFMTRSREQRKAEKGMQ